MSDAKQIIISASDFRDLNFCHRKVWLDIHGNRLERDRPTIDQSIRLARGVVHERQVHEATTERITPVPVTSWQDGIKTTRAQMAQGEPGIIGGYLEHTTTVDGVSVTIRGRPDRLVRIKGYNEPAVYMPIEIKHAREVKESDILQLDCYVWLLAQIQGFIPPAEFWMAQGFGGRPEQRIRHRFDKYRLQDALETMVNYHLQTIDKPEIYIDSRCKGCHWVSQCKRTAKANYDLSLVFSRKIRDTLHETQISTLNQIIELSPDELRQFKGIKTRAERFHAHARAWIEDQPVVYREIPEICTGDAWHFDIEFDQSGSIWSIGWNRNGDLPEIVLVNPDQAGWTHTLPTGQQVFTVSDADEAWRVFTKAVLEDSTPIFHWTDVEKSMVKKTAPEDVKSHLSDRLSDLHRHYCDTVAFPIYSTSLKEVARYLGFHWAAYDFWYLAYTDYQHWLETGDENALVKLCAYQSDDVTAMAVIRQWMVQNRV